MFAQTKHFTLSNGGNNDDRLATLDGIGMGAIMQTSGGGIDDWLSKVTDIASKGVDIFDKLKNKKDRAPAAQEIKITMPEQKGTNWTPVAVGGGALFVVGMIFLFAMKK